ncbi:MAG: hypothetical protein AAB930_01605, partial [Patescibacteria group bacterium]
ASSSLGIGTSTPYGVLNVAATNTPNLVFTNPLGTVNAKHFYASTTFGNDLAFGIVSDNFNTLTELFRFSTTTRFGIGSTSPAATLSVNGTALISGSATTTGPIYVLSTGTSTFQGGVSISSGGVTIGTMNCSVLTGGGKITTDANGNLVCGNDTSGGGGAGVNSGTTNRLAYYSDSTTLDSSFLTINNSTNQFAIGTTTLTGAPSTLTVYGSTTIQTWVNTANAFRILNAASTSVFTVDTVNASTSILGLLNVGGIGTSTFNGAIRVGTLDVSTTTATSTFANGLLLQGGGIKLSQINCTGYSNGGSLTTDASGNINCSDDAGAGAVTVNTGTANRLAFYSYSSNISQSGFLVMNTASSSLGIGTSTPYGVLNIAATNTPHLVFSNP